MCSTSTGTSKIITYKRTRPNPLFQEWLEELYEEAKAKKSKLEPMLGQALDSLSKYPLPLETGAECAILKGFEKKLCFFLDKRLEVYNYNKSIKSKNETSSSHSETEQEDVLCESREPIVLLNRLIPEETVPKSTCGTQVQKQTISKSKTKYKPSFRSGAYAILLGLLEQFRDDPNMPISKDDLISKAQAHSEESFTRPKPETFYTAWSSMSRLTAKGLVQTNRLNKKVKYSLTEAGISLASQLEHEYANIPTASDMIFNNGAFKSPESVISQPQSTLTKETNIVIEDINMTEEDYIELEGGKFDIILLIDKNETSGVTKTDPTVAEFNKYPKLKHEYRSLKVGDFTWIAQDRNNKEIELVLPYVIERKRMDDLGSSIKDGRFHEQKFRLRKCGIKNVIYLVENFGKNRHVGLPIQSLMQALANTRIQDGFKVHITKSLGSTVKFLAMLSKRLVIKYKDKNLKGCNNESKGESLMTFKYFNASSKKSKPLTVTETFVKLLLQLKGISVEKALAITKKYSTPRLLIERYKECDKKEGEMLIANLKYGESNRSVGPVVSKTIYQLFTKF